MKIKLPEVLVTFCVFSLQGNTLGDGEVREARRQLSQEVKTQSVPAKEDSTVRHHGIDRLQPISTQPEADDVWQWNDSLTTDIHSTGHKDIGHKVKGHDVTCHDVTSDKVVQETTSVTIEHIQTNSKEGNWNQYRHVARQKHIVTGPPRHSMPDIEATCGAQIQEVAPVKVNGVVGCKKVNHPKVPPPPPAPCRGVIRNRDKDYLYCSKSSPTLPVYKSQNMPAGNKVADMDMGCWRRTRPPMVRGLSTPMDNDMTKRPKSAEFHLDLKSSPKRHIYCKRGHSRSPSDGEKPFLSFMRSASPKGNQKESPTPSSPKSPGLLKRMFGLRRSLSRDRGREHNRNKLDSSGSFDELEQNNNTRNVESRSRRCMHFTGRDENQNEAPLSPPIAVFSSDEDISSAPATPRHFNNSGHNSPQVVNHTINPLKNTPDDEHIKVVVEQQGGHKRTLECQDVDIVHRRSASPNAPKELKSSPKRFFAWRDSLHLRKYDWNQCAELPDEIAMSPSRQFTKPEDPHKTTTSPSKQFTKSIKDPYKAATFGGESLAKKQAYARQRHHTVDLANIVIYTPEGEALPAPSIHEPPPMPIMRYYSSPQRSHRPASPLVSAVVNPWNLPQRNTSPQRSASSSGSNTNPTTPSPHGSYGGSETDELGDRVSGRRRSWGRRGPYGLSPQDLDRVAHMMHVEISSTDSGIQHDAGQSSSESLRVSTTIALHIAVCRTPIEGRYGIV